MKDTREVVRGIGVTDFDESGKNGKYRVVTDPDVIAGMYEQAELDAFVESGILKADNPGEWKSTKARGDEPEGEAAKPEKAGGKAKK